VNTGAGTVLARHENVGIGQAGRLRYFEEAMFTGLWDRWRVGVVAPLMIEHKPLRLTYQREV
jgi:hypothetical protein